MTSEKEAIETVLRWLVGFFTAKKHDAPPTAEFLQSSEAVCAACGSVRGFGRACPQDSGCVWAQKKGSEE